MLRRWEKAKAKEADALGWERVLPLLLFSQTSFLATFVLQDVLHVTEPLLVGLHA